jgi:hypothetical protein
MISSIAYYGASAITFWTGFVILYIHWTQARKHRKLKFAVYFSLIPIVLVVAYAIWKHSLLYAGVAVVLLSITTVAPLYERYILEFQNNDVALIVSIGPALLLSPFSLGTVQSSNLTSLYSDTLQSALTLIGLVFTIGIFFLQTQQVAEKELIENMLKAFLALFVILSILATVGLVSLHGNIDMSKQALVGRSNLVSSNSVAVYIFIGILCMLVASLTYLLNVFTILINPKRRKRPSY